MIPVGDVSYAEQRYNSYEADVDKNFRQYVYDEYRKVFPVTDTELWHDWLQYAKSQKKVYYWNYRANVFFHTLKRTVAYYRLVRSNRIGTVLYPVGHYDATGGFGAAKEGVQVQKAGDTPWNPYAPPPPGTSQSTVQKSGDTPWNPYAPPPPGADKKSNEWDPYG